MVSIFLSHTDRYTWYREKLTAIPQFQFQMVGENPTSLYCVWAGGREFILDLNNYRKGNSFMYFKKSGCWNPPA